MEDADGPQLYVPRNFRWDRTGAKWIKIVDALEEESVSVAQG